jgi:hypothetical protein
LEVPTPELEDRLPPDDLDELPLPEGHLVLRAMAPNERCVRACRGRVDGAEGDVVYATMRDADGSLSRVELAADLFARTPYRDMRFVLLLTSRRPTPAVGLPAHGNAMEFTCRVIILPACRVVLPRGEGTEGESEAK